MYGGNNAQKCMMAAMFYEGWYVSSANVEILANYAPTETNLLLSLINHKSDWSVTTFV